MDKLRGVWVMTGKVRCYKAVIQSPSVSCAHRRCWISFCLNDHMVKKHVDHLNVLGYLKAT